MNNGPAERKRPNQTPEHAREITIQQTRACIHVVLPYPVMGASASWRKAARLRFNRTACNSDLKRGACWVHQS